ncbi:MAG: hypothetical protein ACI87T_003892, partial [Planctomycetota bacterium]
MTDNKTEEDLASALANKALDDEALDGEEPQDEPGPEAIIAALEAER